MDKWWLWLFVTLVLTGCGRETSAETDTASLPAPTSTQVPVVSDSAVAVELSTSTFTPAASATRVSTRTPTMTAEPTFTPPPTFTPTPTLTLAPTATSEPTATPDPYEGLSIASLRAERFGEEGEIEIVRVLGESAAFTRYEIAFPSDGLRVGGFMNVPAGEGPFPIVILNHGYMPPASYETLTYTTKYADVLAAAGFLVVHPSFRNHRGSDEGPNPFRIGLARDVLHLIPMVQRLPQADGRPVGMWGHSMGGGVTLRVLTTTDQVAAAVLYGSMSGDEAKNYEAIVRWSGGSALQNGSLPEPPTNRALYDAVSPLNYVDSINAALAIHHGVLDDQVPFSWSEELAQRLDSAGRPYDFYPYPDQNHNFTGEGYNLLNERVIAFFREHLGGS